MMQIITRFSNQAMGELGDHRALPVLLEGLRDKNPFLVEQTEKVHFTFYVSSFAMLRVILLKCMASTQLLLSGLVNLIVYELVN